MPFESAAPQNQQIKFMICDGHRMVAEALRQYLLNNGVPSVELCYSDAQLNKSIETGSKYDIILYDPETASNSDLAYLSDLLKIQPRVEKIIIITGSNDMRFIAECLRLGAAGAVSKSQSARSIMATIDLISEGDSFVPFVLQKHNDVDFDNLADYAKSKSILSDYQRRLISLIADGYSNRELAEYFKSSEAVIKRDVKRMLDSLGVKNRTAGALLAARYGLIEHMS